ncbi:MAG: hypothetical protein L0Y56_18395 [Nitrospira sp.]|nr:hypothetical protein [Nitrospira sp.]
MANEEMTKVIIFTSNYRIEGEVALLPGARLTDYIRHAQDFIAVTNVVVFGKNGEKVISSKFMDIGKEYIEIILPIEMIVE